MKKHINIPVFIPMLGCPFACIYCNQNEISGKSKPDFSKVEEEIKGQLANTNPKEQEIQIAFFGGTFTGIDKSDMIYLLEIANKFIKAGQVHSIRCSTRPDFINEEIVGILKKYNMKTVELGVQSSNDDVLKLCRRGHNFEQTKKAAKLLTDAGLEFVGQMMVGLPGSCKQDEIQTAYEIVKLNAVGARIYPCVVMKNTYLAHMANNGLYSPLTLDDEIERCEEVFSVFVKNNVDVIRIGLQSSENLVSGEDVECGIYDEAIGEKCYSLFFKKRIQEILDKSDTIEKDVKVFVNPKRISSCIGHKRQNAIEIKKQYGLKSISFEPINTLSEFEIYLEIGI